MDESGEIRPLPGRVQRLAPGLRVVLAPNPSAMTLHGTNSYILGEGDVAVIDPGPADPAHLAALLAALGPGERVSHILVTHAHLDHSPLARPLAERTGAPVLAFGPATAGRSATMARLAAAGGAGGEGPGLGPGGAGLGGAGPGGAGLEGAGLGGAGLGGGEGVDTGFVPDVALADGDIVEGTGWRLRALHTPGHFGNHLSFVWRDTVFAGDHVMGWASSLVSPPDGDMGAYMASLDKLAALGARRLWSGHGDPVADPAARIAALAAHRRARETAILAALARGPADAATLARAVYTDTPAALMPAAARNVLAHLIDLAERTLVASDGPPAAASRFSRT